MAKKKEISVWCVQGATATQDSLGRDLFRTEGVVALDEPCLPDLSQLLQTREMRNRERSTAWSRSILNRRQKTQTRDMYKAMYEAIKKIYQPDYSQIGDDSLGSKIAHLFRFVYEAKQGDLVVYPGREEEEVVYIGEIISDYFYVDCCYRHRRRVDWHDFPKVPVNYGPEKGFKRMDKRYAPKFVNKWTFGKKG